MDAGPYSHWHYESVDHWDGARLARVGGSALNVGTPTVLAYVSLVVAFQGAPVSRRHWSSPHACGPVRAKSRIDYACAVAWKEWALDPEAAGGALVLASFREALGGDPVLGAFATVRRRGAASVVRCCQQKGAVRSQTVRRGVLMYLGEQMTRRAEHWTSAGASLL